MAVWALNLQLPPQMFNQWDVNNTAISSVSSNLFFLVFHFPSLTQSTHTLPSIFLPPPLFCLCVISFLLEYLDSWKHWNQSLLPSSKVPSLMLTLGLEFLALKSFTLKVTAGNSKFTFRFLLHLPGYWAEILSLPPFVLDSSRVMSFWNWYKVTHVHMPHVPLDSLSNITVALPEFWPLCNQGTKFVFYHNYLVQSLAQCGGGFVSLHYHFSGENIFLHVLNREKN